MLRKIGIALVVVGVIGFTIAFIHVFTTDDIPSSCSGSACFHGENRWLLALPGSIFTFVGGVLMVAFGGRGYSKSSGPKTFDEVRAGTATSIPDSSGFRSAPRWTRSWMNVYGWTAAGELFLATLFFIAGVVRSDARAGAWLTAAILGAVGLGLGYAGYRTAMKDRLHDIGLEGKATILSIEQTGMWINNNPVAVLKLRIQLDGYPPYEVRHRETVPAVAVGRLTSGDTLPVKVDPNRPSHYVIEWESV